MEFTIINNDEKNIYYILVKCTGIKYISLILLAKINTINIYSIISVL